MSEKALLQKQTQVKFKIVDTFLQVSLPLPDISIKRIMGGNDLISWA